MCTTFDGVTAFCQLANKRIRYATRRARRTRTSSCISVEVCMGMGKTGIPWVPWDSHGNGSKISQGMGMGWEWELIAWEWELRRESCHQQLWIVFCSYIVTWSKGSNAGGATA